MPRFLHENATRRSNPQPGHPTRRKPCSRNPERHARIAIAGYPKTAIASSVAIFDGKRRAEPPPDGAEARYLLGIVKNVTGTFAPLAKVEGNERYAVVNDHLGVPQLLTDEKGSIAWKAQLDVYGVPRDEIAGGVEQPVRFPGQVFDVETGLFYNRHRYYDAETGSYLSQDPIGLAGSLRLYGYVGCPLSWMDPFGEEGHHVFPKEPAGRGHRGGRSFR